MSASVSQDRVTETQPMLYARLPPRLWALLVDAGVFVGLALAILIPGMLLRRVVPVTATFLATVVVLSLYDPLLVSVTGSTIGHRMQNLRVVRAADGGRLHFGMAFVRCWLKWFLGLFSFAFVLTSRKHQSLHDMATRSVMTHRDPMVFEPESFAAERLPDPDLRSLSSLRRVLVIIGYALAATVAFYLIIDAFVSDACLLQGTCSPMEKLISLSVRIAWIVGTSFVVVLGWRGRLPGARVRHAVTDRRP